MNTNQKHTLAMSHPTTQKCKEYKKNVAWVLLNQDKIESLLALVKDFDVEQRFILMTSSPLNIESLDYQVTFASLLLQKKQFDIFFMLSKGFNKQQVYNILSTRDALRWSGCSDGTIGMMLLRNGLYDQFVSMASGFSYNKLITVFSQLPKKHSFFFYQTNGNSILLNELEKLSDKHIIELLSCCSAHEINNLYRESSKSKVRVSDILAFLLMSALILELETTILQKNKIFYECTIRPNRIKHYISAIFTIYYDYSITNTHRRIITEQLYMLIIGLSKTSYKPLLCAELERYPDYLHTKKYSESIALITYANYLKIKSIDNSDDAIYLAITYAQSKDSHYKINPEVRENSSTPNLTIHKNKRLLQNCSLC